MSDESREQHCRRELKKRGLALHKSRVKTENLDNLGGYMIADIQHNAVVAGGKFELSLADVEEFLKD